MNIMPVIYAIDVQMSTLNSHYRVLPISHLINNKAAHNQLFNSLRFYEIALNRYQPRQRVTTDLIPLQFRRSNSLPVIFIKIITRKHNA